MTAPDLNDRHVAGELSNAKTRPVNSEARVREEDARRLLTVRQLLVGAEERTRAPKIDACTFGHYDVDRDTGGILPGFMWVFGADTSWGKSSLCVMIADENIKLGRRCLIVSAEDSEALYGDRLMCRRACVNATRFRERRLNEDEAIRARNVANEGEDIPVFLDARGKSAEWAADRVRKIIHGEGIDLVMFDYLQAFDNQKAQQDRRNQITYIARILTDVIKTERKAGIIFSQITVSEAKGKGAKSHPDKHSIRESRDVSNAAEVVALGFIPENGVKSKNGGFKVQPGKRAVLLDKVKNGTAKRFHEMPWDDNSASFETTGNPHLEAHDHMMQEMGMGDLEFDNE